MIVDRSMSETTVAAVKDHRRDRCRRARAADYEHGWSSDIEQEFGPKGLSEDTVRYISGKKNEPEWMLEWRLKAYRHWLTMETPDWGPSCRCRRSITRPPITTPRPR